MRSKLVLAVLVLLSSLTAYSQVAPAAKIGGLPLGVGFGIQDYSIDYLPGDRMIGVSAWLDYKIYHGFGIEVEGTDLFAGKPSRIPRFSQKAVKGGLIYKAPTFWGLHPYAKGLIGITQGNFAIRNPFYTQDDFTTYAAGGGLEYKVWRNVFVRADYEYEFEHNYLSLHDLNPNGVTIGATYYLRAPGRHRKF